MAEIEISAEHDHANDPFGRRVGVMVAMIGIVLAVVTIASHRAHTATVIAKTEANDQWTFFQAKKIREHLLDVGAGLATALGGRSARTVRGAGWKAITSAIAIATTRMPRLSRLRHVPRASTRRA